MSNEVKETIRKCAAAMCRRCGKGQPADWDRYRLDFGHPLSKLTSEGCKASAIRREFPEAFEVDKPGPEGAGL